MTLTLSLPLRRTRPSSTPHILTTTTLLLLLLSLAPPALADCECGYLATLNPSDTPIASNHAQTALFTDLLETDFTRLPSTTTPLTQNTDWAPQAFNLTHERARGEYGEMFAVDNVLLGREGEGEGGGDDGEEPRMGAGENRGLELVVRAELVDGMVPVAELATRRLDLMWGTFRARMKVSGVGGTCAAFFWVSFTLFFPGLSLSLGFWLVITYLP